jgi:hypothetical protein
MHMTLEYIGGWGDRVESLRESARRMQRSWEEFPNDHGVYTPWSLQSYPDGVLRLEPVPGDDLDAIVDAGRLVTERVNEGPRTAPGFNLEFARERRDSSVLASDGQLFSYNVRCGFGGPRALRNHIFFELDPLGGNTSDENQLLRDHLVALARAWEPEYVSVCTYAFHKAQRHKTPQVRVGWLTYIRNDVALDSSAIPDTVRIEAGDGGKYLMLTGTPQDPNIDEALALRRALSYQK